MQFCGKCGSGLEKRCPKCRFSNPPDFVFCGKCGIGLSTPEKISGIDYSQPQSYTPKYLADKILTTRSSIEGERKLVTVLFADVANYTTISEKLDPEEVHQMMDACFKILMDEIHNCEGTINQFTGDGVMALFGAPLADEDHAQKAGHAALAIQKAMGENEKRIQKDLGLEFKMRIGLNSGPVIVGSIGDDLRMDYTAVGDTTNLASRMQTMARPGSILVSGHTYKLTRNFFEFKSHRMMPVKGKEKPQETYELIKPGEVETRIEASVVKGLTKFVGREKQMEILNESFEEARHGSGNVVGIVGEAGVGKSRILLELKNKLVQEKALFLEGRCLHYGNVMAYVPVLDILQSYFDIQERDREYVIKKKIEIKLAQLGGRRPVNPSALHDILSLNVDDEKYIQLEYQQKRERIFQTIADILLMESQKRPTVIAVEDLQWIDETSNEFWNFLIGRLPRTHILLLLLHRPEYTHNWASKSYFTQISLNQLSSNSSAELVQAILDSGQIALELRDLILDKAGGNPLFVEEITHSLLENGSIHKKNDQYMLKKSASEIEVPNTIHGIIAARMDRLEDTLKKIMQSASVIGREFAYQILETITGMHDELKPYLFNLQGMEFIYEKQLFPELEFIFKHALTQEVAYNSLLLQKRRKIHEQIGKAIEEIYAEKLEEYYQLLAHHYVRSPNTKKAVKYLALTNKKAIKAYALEAAKNYFDKAMELLDTLPANKENNEQRIALLVDQTIVFHLLFKLPDYYDLLTRYEPLVDSLDNPKLRGNFHCRLGFCEFSFGQFDKAIQTLTKAARLSEATGNIKDAGHAYAFLVWSHLYRGNYDRVLDVKEDVIRTMGQEFTLRWYVWAFAGAAVAYGCLGRFDEAIDIGQKALMVARDFSDNSLISFAAWALTCPYTLKGDLERAIEYGELAVKKAPTLGDKIWSMASLAWALGRSGKPIKSIESLASIVPVLQKGRHIPPAIQSTLCLNEGYQLAGQYETAKQALEESLEMLLEPCGARYHIAWAHRLLGEIALETDPNQATPHFEKSISILREIKSENELAMAYAGMGRSNKQQGHMAKAREYLTRALEIFERLGSLNEPGKIRKELAGLSEKEGHRF